MLIGTQHSHRRRPTIAVCASINPSVMVQPLKAKDYRVAVIIPNVLTFRVVEHLDVTEHVLAGLIT